MDTSLKKSKKIRAFIYELIAVISLLTMISTALLGREALINLYKEGPGTFTGEIYYLTEFREYISEVYTLGMLGFAGVGDDNGYPLTGNSAETVEGNARNMFLEKTGKAGDDILYHIKDKLRTVSKANFTYPLFSEYDGHLIMPDNAKMCCYWDGSEKQIHFFTEDAFLPVQGPEKYYVHHYKPNAENIADIKLLIALKDTDTYASAYLQDLQMLAGNYRIVLFTVCGCGVLFVFFGLLSLLAHKAKKAAKQGCAEFTANIWLEWKLILICALFLLCYSFNLWYYTGSFPARMYGKHYLWLYMPMFTMLYIFLLDWSRNQESFFQNSFLGHTLKELHGYFKKKAWQRKASSMYLAYCISAILLLLSGMLLWFFMLNEGVRINTLYALIILLLAAGCLMLFFSIRLKGFVSDTLAIAEKLTDITNGTGGKELAFEQSSLLKQAATDLNEVEHGIEAAVEQNIRANKMRVELITNVSHDLKTPLTSIINYADLLCEENLPAPADEYAEALRNKAYRLKGMVQDVFELSKATSGNLTIEKTRLDLAKLIRQTLADMDEQIQQSTLTFKLSILTEPLMIEADGDKLYRVFQNLILNALQYSLENSRVYIQLDKEDTNAVAHIKNTSRQELDFDPDEIVERFARADASRTTEGSGLGLSIVQSFTEACGGSFSIELNADLFIASVSFPLDTEKPIEAVSPPIQITDSTETIELCEEEENQQPED